MRTRKPTAPPPTAHTHLRVVLELVHLLGPGHQRQGVRVHVESKQVVAAHFVGDQGRQQRGHKVIELSSGPVVQIAAEGPHEGEHVDDVHLYVQREDGDGRCKGYSEEGSCGNVDMKSQIV